MHPLSPRFLKKKRKSLASRFDAKVNYFGKVILQVLRKHINLENLERTFTIFSKVWKKERVKFLEFKCWKTMCRKLIVPIGILTNVLRYFTPFLALVLRERETSRWVEYESNALLGIVFAINFAAVQKLFRINRIPVSGSKKQMGSVGGRLSLPLSPFFRARNKLAFILARAAT